ncbi:uncharacterized protein LOC125500557 [Athalia rosae]|uniref:uncharacterized protein LOC125500557 n=1 Tax=Athalia rosae TaxID=37344 RepID=UPI002033E83B|nr:uncharacterized protein LOC125500557 [Athalia rosae]
MELPAPYLQAIQAIPGSTPGEKYRKINTISHELAAKIRKSGQRSSAVSDEIEILDVPEPLKPLIRVEVGKILRQEHEVIAALKSEDIKVVFRALQAKWFFKGNAKSGAVNANYFRDSVFPEISLYARLKVIKNLGLYLKEPKVGADFFNLVSELYGVNQAAPLLVACDENFSFQMIVEKKLVLTSRMVRILYRKYPNLVIRYLLLGVSDNENRRNLHNINIRDYEEFLAEMANTRFEDFMNIYTKTKHMAVKLGKRGASTFIKSRLDLLIEKPEDYVNLISLKKLTEELSGEDFAKMLKNWFPREIDDFRFGKVREFLKYYRPERDRLTLILNTFREVYGKDLLGCKKLIDCEILKMLPVNERVAQAKIKLENDRDWHYGDDKNSWRCYLTANESIPMIKNEIAKNSDVYKRGELLQQLVYTCAVNEDQKALLEVLNYVYNRHRNDQKYMIFEFLEYVSREFKTALLSPAHWEVFNKFIKKGEIEGDFEEKQEIFMPLIESALHHCVLNNLPMDDYVRMMVDLILKSWYRHWNILKKDSRLEKRFLNIFIDVIPKQYPSGDKIWKQKRTERAVCKILAESVWDYNERHSISNGKLKKLSVKDYPWLYEKIQNYLNGDEGKEHRAKGAFLELLKKNERDLYNDWLRGANDFWNFGFEVIVDVLKESPEKIMENWKNCLTVVQKTIHFESEPSIFVGRTLWYDRIPVEFFNYSLADFRGSKDCPVGSIVTLALLADGETYGKIIEPYVPTVERMDVDEPDARNKYDIVLAIASNLRKVNPPVGLDVISRFCVGDYLQMAMRSITSVCRRVPVAKVIEFAVTLTGRRVSVTKHGIRTMYLVASLEEIYVYLTEQWNKQTHRSIRHVIFTKIYDLFSSKPDPKSWEMMKNCLDNLTANDDDNIMKKIIGLSSVPNEYVYEYTSKLFDVLKTMEENSDSPNIYADYTRRLIRNIDASVADILPENFSENLIKKYLFDLNFDQATFNAISGFTIRSYLLASKTFNEIRWKFFQDYLKECLKNYWNKRHPKSRKFRPMNYMLNDFVVDLCNGSEKDHDIRIFQSISEALLTTIKPFDDPVSFLQLIFSIEYNRSDNSVDFANRILNKIPELIDTFSMEYVVSDLPEKLSDFLKTRQFNESESDDEKILSVIEVFANSNSIHCAFVAAHFLFENKSKTLENRHRSVVQTLFNYNHPAISSILNERLLSIKFSSDAEDDEDC